jgi:hypothetical protein
LSGISQAQECLDRADKLIFHGTRRDIIPHLREAMFPYKQKNVELKQKVSSSLCLVNASETPTDHYM